MKTFIYLLFLTFLFLFSCDKSSPAPIVPDSGVMDQPKEDNNSSNDDSLDGADEYTEIKEDELLIAYFPETETPYIFIDENEYVVINLDLDADLVLDAVLLRYEESDILIKYNPETSLVEYLITSEGEEVTFFFNEELTVSDVAYQKSSGDIEHFSIAIDPADFTYDNNGDKIGRKTNKSNTTLEGVLAVLQTTSFVVSGISCLVYSASALATSGWSLVLTGAQAAVACTAAVVGIKDLVQKHKNSDALIEEETVNIVTGADVLFQLGVCFGTQNGGNCFGAFASIYNLTIQGLVEKKIRLEEFQNNTQMLEEFYQVSGSFGTAHAGPCTTTSSNTSTTTNFDGESNTTTNGDTTDSCLNGGMSFFKDQNGAWVNNPYGISYDSGSAKISIIGRTVSAVFNYSRASNSSDEASCTKVESNSSENVSYRFFGSKKNSTDRNFEGVFTFFYSYNSSSTTSRTCEPIQSTTTTGSGFSNTSGKAIGN